MPSFIFAEVTVSSPKHGRLFSYDKEFPESTAEIKHMGADGDMVFIHNHIKLNAQDRGQAAVDIFPSGPP